MMIPKGFLNNRYPAHHPALFIFMMLLILWGESKHPLHAQSFSGFWITSSLKERIYGNASWQEFEKKWKELKRKNFRLADIEVAVHRSGQRKYFGVWHAASDTSSITNQALTWEGFKQRWDQEKRASLRLVDLETYRLNGEQRFLGVWRQGTYEHQIFDNWTRKKLIEEWKKQIDYGYYLADIEVYKHYGSERYAGIWKKETKEGLQLWLGVKRSTFLDIYARLREQRFMLLDLETYFDAKGVRKYVSIWARDAGNSQHKLWIDLSWPQFLAKWKHIGRDNMGLRDLEITTR